MDKHARKRGAPPATTQSRANDATAALKPLTDAERAEFLSFIAYHFSREKTTHRELAEVLRIQFEQEPARCQRYLVVLKELHLVRLLARFACAGQLTFSPTIDEDLEREVESRYARALRGKSLKVVPALVPEVFTDAAAEVIADAILNEARKNNGEVHVGFAGGWTLRSVTEHLAARLRQPGCETYLNTLVFHSLVAAFEDNDNFFDDPSSFLAYFSYPTRPPFEVRHVKMQVPAIVERKYFDESLKTRPEFSRAFDEAQKISILVTSGSLWNDEHSIVKYQLRAFADRCWSGEGRAEKWIRALSRQGVVGDLLWHPLKQGGWVNLKDLEFRIATAIDLADVPRLIRTENLTSIVVLGCSGRTRRDKAALVDAVLRLPPNKQVLTHLVIDALTARRVLALPQPSRSRQPQRRRPR